MKLTLMERLRVVLLAGIATAAAGGLGTLAVGETARLWADRGSLSFDELVLAVAVGVLLAALAWVAFTLLVVAVAESGRLGSRLAGGLARACAPGFVYVVVRAACGVAAVAAPALLTGTPAGAATAFACSPTACAGDLAGPPRLPLPNRPDGRSSPARSSAHSAEPAEPSSALVLVRPGDTLWATAARHLPRHAIDADIARAWPAWYRANRAHIGPDPDLIFPGTRLQPPANQPRLHSCPDPT
ncbi:MAG: hypothetical protein GEU93_05785 [Propionibacteriales bacterium]|nr:hypothetical protein [Propionibacteriales bacterium]